MAKILVVGQPSVGKTSLVRQLVNGLRPDDHELKTQGVEIVPWTVDGDEAGSSEPLSLVSGISVARKSSSRRTAF